MSEGVTTGSVNSKYLGALRSSLSGALRRGGPSPAAHPGDASIPGHDDVDGTATPETETDSGIANDQPDVSAPGPRPKRATRVLTFGVLPAVALMLTGAAAYLKYDHSTLALRETAAAESVPAARDIATAMLSYAPDTAEATLTKAADRMSGTFRDSFLSLVKEVVAPGAKQKNVSATATVPSVAVTSTTPSSATLVLFVNQAITIAGGPPSNTTSVVQVNLQKDGQQWKMTSFEPK